MFKCLIILTLCFGSGKVAFAQVSATTSDGRTVLLLPDGTWKYAAVTKGTTLGSVPAGATEKVDLWRGKGTVFYNPAHWRITTTEPGRVNLLHQDGDLYASVIPERMTITLEALKQIAINNAREFAADATVVEERMVRVNDMDVLEMQINATYQGIPIVYVGRYYAGPDGVVQVLTYTSANLFEEYKPDILAFLNGLNVTPVR